MARRARRRLTVGIFSVGRTDYSYFKPIMQEMRRDGRFVVRLIAAGMHLAPAFGETWREMAADGFTPDERVECTLGSDSPEAVAKTTALCTMTLPTILNRGELDALLVLGDRYETLGAVLAALPYNIPVAHLSGGDITEGLIDERIRHALTKLSHLHFPSNPLSARRIRQLGEEAWRVVTVGSTSLDLMRRQRLLTRAALGRRLGLDLHGDFLLVTYHPVTLQAAAGAAQVRAVVQALAAYPLPQVITWPNADPGSQEIVRAFTAYAATRDDVRFVSHLGAAGYYSAMRYAAAMVGNSSSGIVESATYRLPVVDIGDRQRNRLAARNVVHVPCTARGIERGLAQVLDPKFRRSLHSLRSPYGDGNASRRLVTALYRLLTCTPREKLITKRFVLR